jgi:hypothetical protein
MSHAIVSENADTQWATLYKIGGAAALFSVVLIPIQLVVYMAWPPPETVIGWFTRFQDNALVGLLSFEFLFVVNAVLGVTTTLALYAALRRTNPSLMAIALALGLFGSLALIVARPFAEMLALSRQYAAATSDAQRAALLAAGEVMMALTNGTTFHVSYNLANIVLVIVPLVMLQGKRFSKATASSGLMSGIIGFGLYVPVIGIYISILSVLFYGVWYILVARRLFQLGRNV